MNRFYLILFIIFSISKAIASLEGTYTPSSEAECPEFSISERLPISNLLEDSRVYINVLEPKDGFECQKEDMFGILEIYGVQIKEIPLYKKKCRNLDDYVEKKAVVNYSDNEIIVDASGFYYDKCESFLGIKVPCLKSWDVYWSLKKDSDKVFYEWKLNLKDGTKDEGSCLLKQI